MQLLRYGLGLRRRAQRAAAGRDAEAASRQAALHRHQDSSEEPQVAGEAVIRRSTTSSPPTTSANTPRRAWRTSASRRSTCSSCTSGPMSGRPTIAGSARSRALKDEGLVRALGISVNRWQPANVLRALESGLIDAVQVVYNVFDQSPEDELFPYCQKHRDRDHRQGAIRRRQPHRHADRDVDLAGGRLPEPLLQPRQPAGHASPRRPAAHGRSGGHVDAAAGAAAHPGAPGRLDGHPGDAEARPRRAEPRA